MTQVSSAARRESPSHVRDEIEDFLARRLEAEAERAFEAHLLVCDECFTAYFVRTMDEI